MKDFVRNEMAVIPKMVNNAKQKCGFRSYPIYWSLNKV